MGGQGSAAGALDALIIDAAQRQALVAVRELGRAGLRVGAAECARGAPAFASRWCRERALLPDFATDEEAFADALVELCAARRARVLIPSHDGSIEALRRRRADLERVVGVALAREEALAVAMDKPSTLGLARELGVRVPRGVAVRDVSEVEGALAEVGLPAVVKPARSWAGGADGGVRLNATAVRTRAAARAAVEAVLTRGVGVVLQEWLPGAREAISVLYAEGRVWARFAQRATRTVPPLGGSSVARVSIALPADVDGAAERLVRALELEGYSEIEFRRDARGAAALMEINPRLSASVELAVRAGVPFPELLYRWAAGERLRERVGYRSGVRMRWLGGDLSWFKKVWGDQGEPDSPSRACAVAVVLADCARAQGYDYLDVRDPRPALAASVGALRKLRVGGGGSGGLDTEVAVIGAGPYGLSIAAHLGARGVAHEIFGEAMDTWRNHMPRGMCLKSEGAASNLSDARGELTLGRFCAERGIEYGDVGVPVALETFERYGRAFQERLVPALRGQMVTRVRERADGVGSGFELELDDGQMLRARRVVVASGLQGHAYLPPELRGLPAERVVHSFDQRDPALWRGLEVAVLGAGQSALDAAVLLHEQGAAVTVIARTRRLVWNADPVLGGRSAWARVRYPSSGLGEGLRLRVYASHPLVVHAAPARRRLGVAYTALGPAGAWWLRPRFEGSVRALLGRGVRAVEPEGERLRLHLGGPDAAAPHNAAASHNAAAAHDATSRHDAATPHDAAPRPGAAAERDGQLTVARVLAGTGYRPDVGHLAFLDAALRARVASAAGTPVLDRALQSSVAGLHFSGYLAAGSFGPVMRFVYGADFTARRLARVCA
jgi:cation diffusion facilitator CzcD-associated flavoprotein CzcO/predicted ATP-grasp superfamily ATP-dependent carboligase